MIQVIVFYTSCQTFVVAERATRQDGWNSAVTRVIEESKWRPGPGTEIQPVLSQQTGDDISPFSVNWLIFLYWHWWLGHEQNGLCNVCLSGRPSEISINRLYSLRRSQDTGVCTQRMKSNTKYAYFLHWLLVISFAWNFTRCLWIDCKLLSWRCQTI